MNILEGITLFYQYAYYFMRDWDKKAKRPAFFTRFRANVIISVVETWWLLTVYSFIIRLILILPIHKLTLSFEKIIVFALILAYVNHLIIGSEKRHQHYKEIFDSWDKEKHTRWKLYVILMGLSTFGAIYLLGQVNSPHQP